MAKFTSRDPIYRATDLTDIVRELLQRIEDLEELNEKLSKVMSGEEE